ncbi:hypothetical protein K435DRAFT_879953 [Dendrothele bispora CBS 962.96]|uniref:Uncharacterized protein n=1 Tax=Dendrothele bispora (strain CBS 962.96) TaxID=1314807 RepID=A0A4S8KKD5_DENBC|nr:hypothetical protein K435DRAFT_879953 [Dendrothele bispora CBS 962.96]
MLWGEQSNIVNLAGRKPEEELPGVTETWPNIEEPEDSPESEEELEKEHAWSERSGSRKEESPRSATDVVLFVKTFKL